MKFDFDYAKRLAETDPEAFEEYRAKLLAHQLKQSPRLVALQTEVDAARVTMTQAEHLVWLGEQLSVRLEQLAGEFIALNNVINPDRQLIRGYVCKRTPAV